MPRGEFLHGTLALLLLCRLRLIDNCLIGERLLVGGDLLRFLRVIERRLAGRKGEWVAGLLRIARRFGWRSVGLVERRLVLAEWVWTRAGDYRRGHGRLRRRQLSQDDFGIDRLFQNFELAFVLIELLLAQIVGHGLAHEFFCRDFGRGELMLGIELEVEQHLRRGLQEQGGGNALIEVEPFSLFGRAIEHSPVGALGGIERVENKVGQGTFLRHKRRHLRIHTPQRQPHIFFLRGALATEGFGRIGFERLDAEPSECRERHAETGDEREPDLPGAVHKQGSGFRGQE